MREFVEMLHEKVAIYNMMVGSEMLYRRLMRKNGLTACVLVETMNELQQELRARKEGIDAEQEALAVKA